MNTSPRASSRTGTFGPLSSCGIVSIVRDVGGDVLAGLAVASGGGAREAAALVQQRDREPVELGLADEPHRIGDHPLDPRVPRQELVAVEGVVEREHAHFVTDGCERGRQHPADLFERRTLAECRVLRFERLELALDLVVLAVGDLGVVAVVALAVVADEIGERGRRGPRRRTERPAPAARPCAATSRITEGRAFRPDRRPLSPRAARRASPSLDQERR